MQHMVANGMGSARGAGNVSAPQFAAIGNDVDTPNPNLHIGAKNSIEMPPPRRAKTGIAAAETKSANVGDTATKCIADMEASDQNDDAAERDELESLESLLASASAKAPTDTAKAKAKAKTHRKKVAPLKVEPASKKKPAASTKRGPHWCFEESRQQVMCRTGATGPGQSHAIKFHVAGGRDQAVKLANAWVAKTKTELKIK